MYNESDFIAMRAKIDNELLQRAGEHDQATPTTDARINCKGETVSQKSTRGLEGYPLASVYSPIQNFRNLYDPEEALMRGTLFTELDLPFEGESVATGGGCFGK